MIGGFEEGVLELIEFGCWGTSYTKGSLRLPSPKQKQKKKMFIVQLEMGKFYHQVAQHMPCSNCACKRQVSLAGWHLEWRLFSVHTTLTVILSPPQIPTLHSKYGSLNIQYCKYSKECYAHNTEDASKDATPSLKSHRHFIYVCLGLKLPLGFKIWTKIQITT